MISTARTAYAAPGAPTRTLRGIEYEVMARITRRLKAAAARRTEDFPEFAHALGENLKLWTVLGMDVADQDNALPAPLRAQIFYLFEFTDQHSRKLLAGDDVSPDILVDINTSVMRGLRGDGGAA